MANKKIIKLEVEDNKKKTFVEKIKISNGLGDVVGAITSTLGITECESCSERKAKMNQMFSFLNGVRRNLTQDEIDFINEINVTRQVNDGPKLFKISNEIFGLRQEFCNCGGVAKQMVEKLLLVIQRQSIVNDEIENN